MLDRSRNPLPRGAALAALGTPLLLLACGTAARPPIPAAELQARDRAVATQQLDLLGRTMQMLLARLEQDVDAGRPPELDVLLLSGGGARGAFGAGFLRAWRTEVPPDHPLAWREFDVISGISTGALQAPFAAVGTEESLRRIDTLYRSARPDWISVSSFALFSSGPSLADTTVLDDVIRSNLDLDMAAHLAEAQERDQRQVLVGSVDLDLGRPITWLLGDAARRAIDNGDIGELYRPMRASASIPGAFSPVFVDGAMHVDGGLYGLIRTISDPRVGDRLLERWRERRPGAPLPRLRFWVVMNNPLQAPPTTVAATWLAIFARSTDVQLRAQTIQPLEHLALTCELLRIRNGLDAELRWIAIPPSFEWPDVTTEFDSRFTRPLADLGAELGADPASWRGEADLGVAARERAALEAGTEAR